jgi:hypothetical protein
MARLNGETVTLKQEHGPDVDLRVFGDEFYARYETADGYTAVYDPARGLFCFANLESGELKSTGIAITASPPTGLAQGLKDAPAVRTAKASRRRKELEDGLNP